MGVEYGLVIYAGRDGQEGDSHDYYRRMLGFLPPQFTTVWVSDHLQFDMEPTLEGFTLISYLAAEFPRLKFGNFVVGQNYRSPALLAKIGATLRLLLPSSSYSLQIAPSSTTSPSDCDILQMVCAFQCTITVVISAQVPLWFLGRPGEGMHLLQPTPSSSAIRALVEASRKIQRKRFKDAAGVATNSEMRPAEIREYCDLDAAGQSLIKAAMRQLHLSARAYPPHAETGKDDSGFGRE